VRPSSIWRLFATVVLVSLLAACSSESAPSPTAHATDRSSKGTVTGTARIFGGPIMTVSHFAAVGHPASNVTVGIRGGSGVEVLTPTGADGRFSVALAPGTYTLECSSGGAFTIRAGQTTSIDCQFDLA